MTERRWIWAFPLFALMVPSCLPIGDDFSVSTEFAFINFSKRYYAALAIRSTEQDGSETSFQVTPLLPPGAVLRDDFSAYAERACPASLDFQLMLYQRINDSDTDFLPIGLDDEESVQQVPVVAGEISAIPGPCGAASPIGVYTIVNWDADPGWARVKIAQDSSVDAWLEAAGRFDNTDGTWDIQGVDVDLANTPPPDLLESQPIAGQIMLSDGMGVANVGVLLRTRFRVRLDDTDPSNNPDSGYGDPIAYAVTDNQGRFEFQRPPGSYQIEAFSDDYEFAPYVIDVESPQDSITILARPL
jgi:hypothetical protein